MVKREWKYEPFIRAHPRVETWLKDRPKGTRNRFCSLLMDFCEDMNVTPAEWQDLSRREARDLAWRWISTFKGSMSAKASTALGMFKSFYRNKDGEQLPFDSGRGGKHYIKREAKKASYEIIPDKTQTYQVIDAAGHLRDRAMFLLAFQAGVRENVLCHLKFGHVREQLYPEPKIPLMLKVTPDLDIKLASHEIPFYYTGLQGEAVQVLRQYCDLFHKNSSDDAVLFYTRSGLPVNPSFIWRKFRRCAVRSLGKKTARCMWPHSLRKAFRKVARRASVDDEHKEQFMGHKLKGSRESYYDRHDVEELAEVYMRINFAREILANNHAKMKSEIEQLQAQNLSLAGMVEELRVELVAMKTELKALKKPQAVS